MKLKTQKALVVAGVLLSLAVLPSLPRLLGPHWDRLMRSIVIEGERPAAARPDSVKAVEGAEQHIRWFVEGANGYPENRWKAWHLDRAAQYYREASWSEEAIKATINGVLRQEVQKAERLAREADIPHDAFEAAAMMCRLLKDTECLRRVEQIPHGWIQRDHPTFSPD